VNYALCVIAGVCVFGSVVTIARVGQPREPLTPGEVAIITVLNAAIITVLILAAIRLS